MARESKQERTVRAMFDQLSEHMHEMKSIVVNPATKEADVERWCQSLMRSVLGFTATAGYSIRAQETRGKMRPDLVLMKDDKPVCVVEVKKLGFDLNKSDFRTGKVQLREYLNSIGNVRWGILSNGLEWRLYDFSETNYSGVEIVSVELASENGEIELSKKIIDELAWDMAELHESNFSSNNWEAAAKEATAFSPESLAKAILSPEVMKIVGRVIRGEHEYKANQEILFDKVAQLIESGLDDSVQGWNDVKKAELQKHLRSQKRVVRKKRKASPNGTDDSSPSLSATETTSNSETTAQLDSSNKAA